MGPPAKFRRSCACSCASIRGMNGWPLGLRALRLPLCWRCKAWLSMQKCMQSCKHRNLHRVIIVCREIQGRVLSVRTCVIMRWSGQSGERMQVQNRSRKPAWDELWLCDLVRETIIFNLGFWVIYVIRGCSVFTFRFLLPEMPNRSSTAWELTSVRIYWGITRVASELEQSVCNVGETPKYYDSNQKFWGESSKVMYW